MFQGKDFCGLKSFLFTILLDPSVVQNPKKIQEYIAQLPEFLKEFAYLFELLEIPEIKSYEPKCKFLHKNLPQSMRRSENEQPKLDLNLLEGDLGDANASSPTLDALNNSQERICLLLGGQGVGLFFFILKMKDLTPF